MKATDYDKQILAGKLAPGMSFAQKAWALTARVGPGSVTTYGQIAEKLGTQASRAVGGAMHRNPYAPKVPCHRVVGHDGALVGFGGGLKRKQRMLSDEGVRFVNGKVDMARHFTTL